MPAMLTTQDNPHDPRLDFAAWFAWDVQQGYNTCAYLARVTLMSEDFPQEVNEKQIENAIDEIVEIHAGGLYKKLPVEAA